MADRPLDHLVADACVGAGVGDDAGPDREQLAVVVAADGVVEPHRVTLRVEAEALPARQRQEHGALRPLREQSSMALDIEVLFRAEGATRRHVRDAHALFREPQERRDLAAVVPDALALRVDLELAVPVGHGQRRLGLEEGMFDDLGAEGLRDHVRRPRESGIDVAALQLRDRQHVAALVQRGGAVGQRCERVRHRFEHLVLDVDERRRRAGRVARLRGNDGDRVADVRGDLPLRHELAPVALDRSLHALAGYVGGREDGHHARLGERLCGVDADDPRPGVVGEPEGAVKHPRSLHVADEHVVAEGQFRALVARGARADAAAAVGLGQRLAAAGRCGELDRVDHLDVPCAAAEVAEQRMGDLLPRRLGMLVEQHLGLHHDPGRAVPALRSAGRHEALAPHPALLLGETLVGRHVLPLEPGRPLRAGDDRSPLDDHRARTAGAFRCAPVLHRTHSEIGAQQLEQARVLGGLRRDGRSVEDELHGSRLLPDAIPWRRARAR